MEKRLFEILDIMNQNDEANKTETVGVCNSLVEAKTAKGGGHVTMGVPADVLQKVILNKNVVPILLIVDMKEYKRIQEEG